jgi:amino acid permease
MHNPSLQAANHAAAAPSLTAEPRGHAQAHWLLVMCLTGVDYFSTLGYQPSIAFKEAGVLAPLATVVLVVMTLLGAVPVYMYVAGRSPHGQGSLAMLEQLVHGWRGKFLVLVLLGFAATDFVLTKTLSAADAAAHLIHNPLAEQLPEPARNQLYVTMFLLVLLGAMFLRGFREVIGLAVIIVGVYLVLNALIIGSGLVYLAGHPKLLAEWWQHVARGEWRLVDPPLQGTALWTIVLVSLLLFPKMALGLSGFETGVAVMPLVRGAPEDNPQHPAGRIRNTRKLLLTAALIMSCMLLGSALVTTTLIEPEQLLDKHRLHEADYLAKVRRVIDLKPYIDAGGRVREDRIDELGRAHERALAYLAHNEAPHRVFPLFGVWFGTLYDMSTVVILWFAGASAMSALLNLVPRYLPRYGMAPEWSRKFVWMVLFFTGVNLAVTLVFKAQVDAQGSAYATGVMVLICSACVATVIDRWRRRSELIWLWRMPWGYLAITGFFMYTTLVILWEKPDGLKIALCFIAVVVVLSLASRVWRSTELRFGGFQFADEQSRFLWESMKHLEFPVLVPHRPGRTPLAEKERAIRELHRLDATVPIVFIEAELGDPSEFLQTPLMQVKHEEGSFIIQVTRCASIPHVIAALALELSKVGKPPEIHFGWSDESPLVANLNFLLFGQGNVPWLVRELILKAEPDPERQPKVVIG